MKSALKTTKYPVAIQESEVGRDRRARRDPPDIGFRLFQQPAGPTTRPVTSEIPKYPVAIHANRLTVQWRVEGELKLQLSAESDGTVQLSAVADQPRLSNSFFAPNRNHETARPAACPRFLIGVTPYLSKILRQCLMLPDCRHN